MRRYHVGLMRGVALSSVPTSVGERRNPQWRTTTTVKAATTARKVKVATRVASARKAWAATRMDPSASRARAATKARAASRAAARAPGPTRKAATAVAIADAGCIEASDARAGLPR